MKMLFLLLSLLSVTMGVVASENLFDSVCGNDPGRVLWLLNTGIHPDQPDHVDRTPLYAAADGGHLELTELLIMRGADVNKTDDAGYAPLLRATMKNHLEVARLLLQHKANVNAQTKGGDTALMSAAFQADNDMTQLLLRHQANVQAKDKRGATAAILATSHETVQLLLDAKAEIEDKGKR